MRDLDSNNAMLSPPTCVAGLPALRKSNDADVVCKLFQLGYRQGSES